MPFAIRQLISRGYWAPADDGSDLGGATADTPPLDRGDDVKSPLDEAGKTGDSMDDPADKPAETKGDEDGAETPEEKAEREKAEAEAAAKARIRIPKARFDEAQAKARQREQALLEEINKLKGGQQASATQKAVSEARAEIEELQDKYEDLILDGKKDEARKVRRQVDALREELIDYQTNVKSDAARNAAVEELTYNAQLAGYEARYPALNPENEGFDEDKTNEVAALMTMFAKAGQPRDKALAQAVKYALGAPPAPASSDPAQRAADQRAVEARRKAAEASKRQPPNGANVGKDSDKAGGGGTGDIDVLKLDQKKFALLDDDAKARLRGDEL